MKDLYLSLTRGFSFALWSLRRRTGQLIPVAISFLLLAGAVQSVGALHDISSELARQQIARSWRGPYDLLIRPQSAVSEPERSAGWVDPQSMLETYGGISQQQITTIETIAHVAQVTPFATVGWQPVDVLLPVALASKGIYRISAVWNGRWKMESAFVRYVEVTDLTQLTSEQRWSDLDVQEVVTSGDAKAVIYTMQVQAIQAVIGIPMSQQGVLSRALLENLTPTPVMPIALHVERLRGEPSSLAGCIKRIDCWEVQQVRQGTISYRSGAVQLLRYSPTHYVASSQQIMAGEISIVAVDSDMQGPLYRVLLPNLLSVPTFREDVAPQDKLSMPALLPFSMPQRLPLLANAVRFVPLEGACAINGERCYSGVYVRLDGVGQYSQQSLALLQATAASIVARTGLHVDILDGSSLRAVSISLLNTTHGGTMVSVRSMWRALGVAVQIEHGMDGLQVALLVLCSIVCLIAMGAAGILVGIGRRKDALLLRQVGWRRYIVVAALTFDGIALCGPGCLLATGWTLLATKIWASSLSPPVMWMLLGMGVLVYCCSLVAAACSGMGEDVYGFWGRLRNRRSSSQAYRAVVIVEFASGLALASAIFLVTAGYMLVTSFNQGLIVTLLGRQVHEAVEGAQLLLLVILLSAALLAVGLCSRLLLQGRREELQLLSMVGWERRTVMLRILRDACTPALVAGEIGILLAIVVAMLAAASPSLLTMLALLICGPLLGMLLAELAMMGVAWQETGRVF